MLDTYRRVLLRLAGTRPGAAVYKRLLPVLDRIAMRLSGGRYTFVDHVIPTFMLTTTGRRTGQPRTQPLCYVRDGDAWLVVGTNWGGETHPAWTANLAADPRATIRLRGREIPVTATEVTGSEWQDCYRRFETLGPNYVQYLEWAGDRVPRLFRLTPR